MQVKLLRFLENREFMRVGGALTLKLDVRVIAATNRSLEQAVERGAFRQDLYYRLKVVTLTVPPLRERPEDIPLLAWNFIQAFSVEHQKTAKEIAPEAMEALTRYDWPGNVRQLRNAMETVAVFSRGSSIQMEDLPPEIAGAPEPSTAAPVESTLPGESIEVEGLAMSEIEKQAILRALEKTGGNRQKAAQILGIGLRTLQSKLKEYGMTSR
jgi:DNA-binding NtrC family response regulator